jgi:hypothetical protein
VPFEILSTHEFVCKKKKVHMSLGLTFELMYLNNHYFEESVFLSSEYDLGDYSTLEKDRPKNNNSFLKNMPIITLLFYKNIWMNICFINKKLVRFKEFMSHDHLTV